MILPFGEVRRFSGVPVGSVTLQVCANAAFGTIMTAAVTADANSTDLLSFISISNLCSSVIFNIENLQCRYSTHKLGGSNAI